eukprot:scaffold4003_cov165-Amphora_coffeaeformis.AAC.8
MASGYKMRTDPSASDPTLTLEDESHTYSSTGVRRPNDVAILAGTNPFVITCQEAQAYKRWETSLRHAVQEYKTWSSFRRNENVLEYFRVHVGRWVRFLKGTPGARNDLEACWEEMKEVEIMKISKETFQNIEKSTRKVVGWHGVAETKIVRTADDVAFLPGSNSSPLATKCRESKAFELWEAAIKKAVLKFKKSWDAFRRSGGINFYFLKEMGEEKRILRARNANATSDDDADWELMCGEPLTAFMEKQFKYYACLLESPIKVEVKPKPKEPPPAQHQVPIQPLSDLYDGPDEGNSGKVRDAEEINVNVEEQAEPEPPKRKRAKPNPSETLDMSDPNAGNPNHNPDYQDDDEEVEKPKPPPNKKLVCSIYLLSKSLALTLGRIDVKVKTRWKLDRLRQEVDPVLRKKNFLTLGVAWEFYFFESGSFVSRTFESHMSIGDYLLEANQENSISIRVVP